MELGFLNYVDFRCDRNPSTSNLHRGGGTLIAVRNDISYFLLSTPTTNVEQLFVKFSTHNSFFIIHSAYIFSSRPSLVYEFHLSSAQTVVLANTNCTFIFCGD